jgi:hypothetical protein
MTPSAECEAPASTRQVVTVFDDTVTSVPVATMAALAVKEYGETAKPEIVEPDPTTTVHSVLKRVPLP